MSSCSLPFTFWGIVPVIDKRPIGRLVEAFLFRMQERVRRMVAVGMTVMGVMLERVGRVDGIPIGLGRQSIAAVHETTLIVGARLSAAATTKRW